MFQHSPYKEATWEQLDCLRQLGCLPEGHVSSAKADQLIKERQDQWRKLPITSKQEAYLRRRCQWRPGMTRGEASDVIEGVDTFGPRPLWWSGDWPPVPQAQ